MKGHFNESLKELRKDLNTLTGKENKPMKCKKGYEVVPCKSGCGWYLGTFDKDGFPNCRISTGYAKTESEAKLLSMDRQTNCIENEYCNGGRGCF